MRRKYIQTIWLEFPGNMIKLGSDFYLPRSKATVTNHKSCYHYFLLMEKAEVEGVNKVSIYKERNGKNFPISLLCLSY